MTYTATGFSNPVRVIFQAIFRPTIMENTRQTVAQHFRTAIHREREEVHIVERFVLKPFQPFQTRVIDFIQQYAIPICSALLIWYGLRAAL
jgi:hypothetical protein